MNTNRALWLTYCLITALPGVSPTLTQADEPRAVDTATSEGTSPGSWQSILDQITESDLEARKVRSEGPQKAWRLTNRLQALEGRFDTDGMSIGPRNDAPSWSWGLELVGAGPSGAAVPVAPAEPVAMGNRVEYRRPGLTEWYVNDRRGLEQGFTILEPPQGSPARFELLLAHSGTLTPFLDVDAGGLTLRNAEGKTMLAYDGLHALDAAGRKLAARMDLRAAADGGQLVHIEVEVAGAAFPVVVDPLITTQVQKLIAPDAIAAEHLGYSVSISGDTAVVGAYLDDNIVLETGSAYVFERNAEGADHWRRVKKLTASDPAAEDEFGHSVSISGDTIVVGAPRKNGAGSNTGSAYVFARNAGGAENWGEIKKLTAADAAAQDQFGESVSISGDTLLVGAHRGNSTLGSVYVFERNEGGADNWGPIKKLNAADGDSFDFFGFSVSISGDTVVVGVYQDDAPAFNTGSAYVLERNAGGADNWGQVKLLLASDAHTVDYFGVSVSISGDTVVIGAHRDDDAGSNSGSAYVFERNAGGADNWGQIRKLTAADGAEDDLFGESVSVSGDTIVVGAHEDDDAGSFSGSAYVFERNAGGADNWGQIRKLTAADATAFDEFGTSVSISGDTVVVGADFDDNVGPDSGSAYVFTVAGCEWNEIGKPVAADAAADDQFGATVSISGDTAVVGAYANDDAGASSGSAYVFGRNRGGADNWGQVQKLTAADASAGDRFGESVSISGDMAVVGARDDDGTGSAYLFERNEGGADTWGQIEKLTAADAATDDDFGLTASISGDTVVIGAPGDDDAGSFSGSAYVFERNAGGADEWGQVKRLIAADAAAGDVFGSVSVSGDTIVVGALFDDDLGQDSGSAYVFVRNAGGADNWGQVKKLTAADGAAVDFFGESVSISGDRIVVGARNNDDSGSAYLFERNAGGVDNWGQLKKLTAADAAFGMAFGVQVSISGDKVLVGASGDSGAVYGFERNIGGADNWGQIQKLTAADAAPNDAFGFAASVSGETVVVGALFDDDAGSSSGSAYVFRFGCPICGDEFQEAPEACDDGNTLGGDECAADCSVVATGVPGEASPGRDMRASRGAGATIEVTFAPACSATDHTAYRGLGPINGAVQWVASACELGTTGSASFDSGVVLLPGQWLYFVIVGYDGDDEGGYGADSTLAPRPEAVGVGACDRDAGLSTCE